MPFYLRVALVSLFIVVLDQSTKFISLRFFSPFINERGGIGLSLLGITLASAVFWLWRRRSTAWMAGALLLAGGISNLVDRLAVGGVIDIFHFNNFTFNVADVVILTGVMLLLVT